MRNRRVPGAYGARSPRAPQAATHEGARHLADALTRRTRISIETAARDQREVDRRALGRGDAGAEKISRYEARVVAARRQPDDPIAGATRRGVPEVLPIVV